jgi:hypothetical protein
MAVLKSKQLPTRLSGSYILSGSNQTLHGTTIIHGNTTISGSVQNLKGSSADFRIRQDDDTTLVKLETDSGGSSALLLYDNKYHSGGNTVDINSADSTALVIKSGSSTIFTVDRDNTLISGSSVSTGSFGSLVVADKVQGDLTIGDSLNVNKGLNVNVNQEAAYDFRVKSQNLNRVLYTDSNKDKVGIGFHNPGGSDLSSSLHIAGDLTIDSHITGSGNINTTAGRVYEQGTSVIDHATAMAIVFGG